MGKKIAVIFVISFLSISTLSIIVLMLMLPQQNIIPTTVENKYEQINPNEYKYVQTKDISKEALTKQYTISNTDLILFKKQNQYTTGNSDPFTPSTDLTTTDNTQTTNTQTTTTEIPNTK